MAVSLTGSGVVAVVGLVVIGGVAYYLYKHKAQIKDAVDKINPTSDKNIAYQTAKPVTDWLTDLLLPKFDPKEFTGTTKPVGPSPAGSSTGPNFYSTSASNMTASRPGYTPAADARANELEQQIKQDMYSGAGMMGLVPTLDGSFGLPLTPATWGLIAGVSIGLYIYSKKGRRRSRRR